MSNNPYRVVLRIDQDFVADTRHYTREEADKEQQRILKSPTFRAQDLGSAGVRVMHWRTFRRLCEKGSGCTVQRIEDNIKRFGVEASKISNLAVRVEEMKHLLQQQDFKQN